MERERLMLMLVLTESGTFFDAHESIHQELVMRTKNIVSALRSAKTDQEGRERAKTAALLSLAYFVSA